jgi:hypothetical protein
VGKTMKNIFALTLGAVLFVFCFIAAAQQPGKIPRIGFVLGVGGPDPRVDAFRQAAARTRL